MMIFCYKTLGFEFAGIFGEKGDLQSILCVCFGSSGYLYSGTLSGDIYKWKDNVLVENITSAHMVTFFLKKFYI